MVVVAIVVQYHRNQISFNEQINFLNHKKASIGHIIAFGAATGDDDVSSLDSM